MCVLLLEKDDEVEVVTEKEIEIVKDRTGKGVEVEIASEKDRGLGRQDRRTEKNRKKKSMYISI